MGHWIVGSLKPCWRQNIGVCAKRTEFLGDIHVQSGFQSVPASSNYAPLKEFDPTNCADVVFVFLLGARALKMGLFSK